MDMLSTEAQRWARKRNFLKARLKGAVALFSVRLNGDLFTLNEQKKVDIIAHRLDQILHDWDDNNIVSRKKYLKENI